MTGAFDFFSFDTNLSQQNTGREITNSEHFATTDTRTVIAVKIGRVILPVVACISNDHRMRAIGWILFPRLTQLSTRGHHTVPVGHHMRVRRLGFSLIRFMSPDTGVARRSELLPGLIYFVTLSILQ